MLSHERPVARVRDLVARDEVWIVDRDSQNRCRDEQVSVVDVKNQKEREHGETKPTQEPKIDKAIDERTARRPERRRRIVDRPGENPSVLTRTGSGDDRFAFG